MSKGSLAVWLTISGKGSMSRRLPAEIKWSRGDQCRLRVYYNGPGGIDCYLVTMPIERISERNTPLSRCFRGSSDLAELL